MMHRLLAVVGTGLSAVMIAGRPVPAAAPAAPQVREIADLSLRDVAVAVYDSVHPVIYYNPTLMRQFGPDLAIFFMAHEHAHIALRHTRSGALRSDPPQRDRLLQQKELEADCLAARQLGQDGRDGSLAAVRFFSRLGDRSFDAEHPTGTTRAAKILSCMPK
jgi:putative metallopeptidase-like protein